MTVSEGSTRLAFLVVNFGSSALLVQNLAPAVEECQPDLVIVVDCWSSESERLRVIELSNAEGWELVALPDNRGFGGGMNAGAAHARALGATHLLLVNPDARINADALQKLRGAIDNDPFAIVSPRVVDVRGNSWFEGAVVHLDDGATSGRSSRRTAHAGERWEWISGACMMLSARLWDAVGGFDESYFLYWEDVDLSRRVTALGGRLLVLPEATVMHEEGGTHQDRGEGRGKSGTYYRYMIRNRLLFATKHLDEAGVRRWRRTSIRSSWQILLHGGRRQFIRPVAPVKAALLGLREGRSLAAAALRDEQPRRSK